MSVRTRRDNEILIVTVDNPPVNALGATVRAGLKEAIEAAAQAGDIRAIVLNCAGRTFFAGADITEFDGPAIRPDLPEVVDAIEQSSVPVVAAIHGTALGGGLEVALGCHYRIAVPSAKLGLPEVKLGILPGAGGTQRLPRLVGVEAALQMIVVGDPVSASTALDLGLIDKLATEGALEADAIAFAREIASRSEHPVTARGTDKISREAVDPDIYNQFQQRNSRLFKGFEAPAACVEAIRAATELPFEEGLARESELFMKLVTGNQSKALRHIFFATRAAGKLDDVPPETGIIPIARVGILGAGTMGGGIAMNFLSAGIPVTLVEAQQANLDRGTATIRKNYDNTAQKGRLTKDQVERAMALLTPSLDYGDLADCDLVIEAVYEEMGVKREVFARIDGIVKQGAILATNTSFLNVDEIAASTRRPEDVVGLHFFSPANVMKLLEVVRGAKTRDVVLATAMDLAMRINKTAVVSGVCHGFIGNRMLSARQDGANQLLLEGASPWQIDKVLLDFGFPMGPFQMADLAGLDLGWSRETSSRSNLRDIFCESDRRGQKSGKGFYDYDANRNGTPSPEAEQLIAEFRERSGITTRQIEADEILERLLFPLVNEGSLILEEGIAQRASDIDVVWTSGYGWPIYTGGPMFWADTVGIDKIVARLKARADELGSDFRLSQLLQAKADRGERFTA